MWLRRASTLRNWYRRQSPAPQPQPDKAQFSSSRPQQHQSDSGLQGHGPAPQLQPSAAVKYDMGFLSAPPPSAPPLPPPHMPSARRNGGLCSAANAQQPHPLALATPIPGLTLLRDLTQGAPPSDAAARPPASASTGPPEVVAVGLQPPAKKSIKRMVAAGQRPSHMALPPSSTTTPREAKDERQPPSSESGGVPEPTAAYLARSFAPPVTLDRPRHILVILDLNGTLLYRPTRRQPTVFVERPHARRFLAYCLEAYRLAIWSSARPDNVHHMLARLLTSEQRQRCVVIWGRDRLGLSSSDYGARVQCYKRLSAMWNNPEVRASHPAAERGGCWDQSNTVLVDDSPEKGRSEPHNILAVPEFTALQSETVNVLPQVHDYLNALCFQEDISRYMRHNPFNLDPNYRLAPAAAQEL